MCRGDAERRGAAGETEPVRRGEPLQRLPPRDDGADGRVVGMRVVVGGTGHWKKGRGVLSYMAMSERRPEK
jgi:hypothetical protein